MPILMGSGHRPPKLGGYNNQKAVALFKEQIAIWITKLSPELVISGMALGWDQWMAEVALEHGIPLACYLPFEGQESKWPQSSQKHYWELIHAAQEVKVVCEGGYSAFRMQLRNQKMVDDATHCLFCWDGSSGGTANCWKYAQKALMEKRIESIIRIDPRHVLGDKWKAVSPIQTEIFSQDGSWNV